jgi:hypothetical protein
MAFVFVTIQLPLKVQTATSAILQSCIDCEYWERHDPSKKLVRLVHNRLAVLLKHEDLVILTESVGLLKTDHLVDDKDG